MIKVNDERGTYSYMNLVIPQNMLPILTVSMVSDLQLTQRWDVLPSF